MATIEESTQKVQRILVSKFSKVILLEGRLRHRARQHARAGRDPGLGKDKRRQPGVAGPSWAPIGREIPATREFFRWAATEGAGLPVRLTNVYESDDKTTCSACSTHTLLADYLDPDELVNAIGMVGGTADDLDDKIHDQFGGKRWTDDSRAGMTTA